MINQVKSYYKAFRLYGVDSGVTNSLLGKQT